MGRLSLNPLVHLDFVGTLMLIFVGFGWGKPVPFNPYNLRLKRFGPALVSLAGPVSNVIMAVIFGLALNLLTRFSSLPAENGLVQLLFALVVINVILAVFNILPIPPLDGSKILYAFLPDSMMSFKVAFERIGPFILIALVFLAGFIFDSLFGYVINFVVGLVLGS